MSQFEALSRHLNGVTEKNHEHGQWIQVTWNAANSEKVTNPKTFFFTCSEPNYLNRVLKFYHGILNHPVYLHGNLQFQFP